MNFLALLGWAPDGETTIMSRDELIERFSLERVGSSPATFDYAKLDWMNGVYLRALPAERVRRRGSSATCANRASTGPRTRVRAAAPIVQEKIARLDEFAGFAGFLFHDVEPDPALLDARILGGRGRRARGVEPWEAAEIEAALRSSATTSARSRAPCTCRSASP